jgi:hypothetical protein
MKKERNRMYRMRNLPCRDALGNEMMWSVCGFESYTLDDGSTITGGGVLEWCWDEQDAMDRLEMMKNDPRFSKLSIRQEVVIA